MVTHIVIFTWAPGVSSEQIAEFGSEMDRMAAEFSATMSIRHGPDLALREGNGDYALVASFADHAAWSAYQAHPRHQAFVRDFITPIQASRLTIQF